MSAKQLFIIAFDGFRWDYCERYDLPNFKRFAKDGARSSAVKPVFPTLTFPNFYAAATGKYPENHGVVANEFTDSETGSRFSLEDQESQLDVRWYTMNDCEPFWITAKKRGLKVGAYHWLICDVEFKDEKGEPIVLDRFERWTDEASRFRALSFPGRIDVCLDWIVHDQLDLTMLYIDEPDYSAHGYGPDSEKVVDLLRQIDAAVGHLLDKVESLNLQDKLNLVIMSDHGLTACPPEKRFQLLDLLAPQWKGDFELLETGSICTLRALNGADVHDGLLTHLRTSERNFKVFLKEEIPARFHWKNNRRIPDILVLCDEHYCAYGGELDVNQYENGQHGYDNEVQSMHAILFGRGPSFKQAYVTTKATEMIDSYRLFCQLLLIQPKLNDSSDNTVLALLN